MIIKVGSLLVCDTSGKVRMYFQANFHSQSKSNVPVIYLLYDGLAGRSTTTEKQEARDDEHSFLYSS